MVVQTPDQPTRHDSPMPPPPPPGHGPAERRPTVGAVALGVGLIVAGTLWLLAALGVDVPVRSLTPIVLILLGVAVVVAAVRGERDGVIGFAVFVGVWLAIAAVVSTSTDVPLAGAVGDREVEVTTVDDLEDSYRLFAGTQVVDLREVELPAGTTELALSTVLGQVDLVVPPDVAVRVDAHVAAGAINVFGDVVDGVGLSHDDESEGWDAATTRLDLVLRVGLGEVTVRTP